MNQATPAVRRSGNSFAGVRAAAGSSASQLRLVLGAALGMGGGFAASYFATLSLFLKPLAAEFGWGRAQTAAAGGLAMIGLAAGALVVGRVIDRLGPARVIAPSAVLMAVLIALLAALPGQPAVLAGASLAIGFAGVGTSPAGYLAVLAKAFDRRLGLALGAAMVGLGTGTIVMPLLAQRLIDGHGWRGAYVGLAGLSLALAAAAWLLMFGWPSRTSRNDERSAAAATLAAARMTAPATSPAAAVTSAPVTAPAAVLTSTPATATAAPATEGDGLSEALRSPRFWALAAILFVVSAAGLGASIHLAAMLTDGGVSAASAAQIVALAGAGVAIGRVIAGALLDRVQAPRLAAGAFVLGAGGLGLLAVAPALSFAELAVAALLAGFAIGAEGDFIPYAVRRYFGLRSFGALFGTLFGIYALGGVAGPVAFGLAHDRFGGYALVYAAAAFACVLTALATLRLGAYRFAAR